MAYSKRPAPGQATMAASEPVVIASDQTAVPVSFTGSTDAATQTTLATRLSESDFDTKTGALTETAPATDTASSGLNGRLQRIAQRISSLISLLPTSLGQGTMATSLKVVLPSDQSTIPVSLNSVPSHAVTNAGTFATQTTLQVGSAIVGRVGIDQTTPGTTNATSIAQLGANTVSTGNGVSGTGVMRVSLASDSTGNVATIGTSVTPGTGATHLGKAEDAAHTSGDTGVMALAVRNDTPTALAGTTGDYIPLTTDVNGGLWISLATLIRGEDETFDLMKAMPKTSNTYISTATTTVVKSGEGILHTLIVNGGTAGTIIIYDNTAASGTILASFDSTNALATYTFNCTFSTGLTVVTGAATKLSVQAI